MAKKKKVIIKKKNLVIFLILIIITITIIYKSSTTLLKNINKAKEEIKKDTQSEKLSNVSYYKKEYLKRYLNYKKKNKQLTDEEVILHVNIGIDNEFYTNTKEATNLNDFTILVNKYYYLKEDYEPNDLESIDIKYSRSGMKLRKEAKDQFEAMAKDAEKEGLNLIVTSSYRGYDYQKKLYDDYVNTDGKEEADTYSARPGYSEHQTGLCVDIHNGKEIYTNFHKTEEYKWMQKNAHKYGFILRFPEDKVNLTGYQYESWHYRYVGQKIATYIHDNNLCLEEYYAMFLEK